MLIMSEFREGRRIMSLKSLEAGVCWACPPRVWNPLGLGSLRYNNTCFGHIPGFPPGGLEYGLVVLARSSGKPGSEECFNFYD